MTLYDEDLEIRNARLIAVTPDLLDALDRMIAEYDLWDGCNDDGSESGTILSARAASAKAKGQTE